MPNEERLISVFERVEETLKRVGDLPPDSRDAYGFSYGQGFCRYVAGRSSTTGTTRRCASLSSSPDSAPR